jgi:xanthine dehydrogenase accessory factor
MRELLKDLDRWNAESEDIALATVVGVRGSTPKPAGARLGLTRSGRMTGSVSAGCVEGDVFERAVGVLDAGDPVVATYEVTAMPEIEVGLACGGAIDVLIEPFSGDPAWETVREAIAAEEPVAFAVALGPARLLGRRMAVTAGRTVGSIDAGIDEALGNDARRLLGGGEPTVLEYPCEGESASVFIEPMHPRQHLIIVGATDTAVALSRMAKVMGFHVTVLDARPAFATRERFVDADVVRCPESAEEMLGDVALGAASYVVTLTHEPRFDIPTLTAALRSGTAYIGALGSRKTHEKRLDMLRSEGFDDGALGRVHGPVGLDIGGRRAEDIALSILAEIQAVRHGKDPRCQESDRGGS